MKKNIFIFDENKCVGCHACVVACINENGFQSPERWRNVLDSNPLNHPDLPLFYLSIACNHCDEAPCLKLCPALAFQSDPETGAVDHDPERCIGCRYCMWVCPYDAPKFSPFSGIIEKCTFCAHRIEKGQKPACANLCPVGALAFSREEFSMQDSFESSPVPISVGSSLKVIKKQNINGPRMDREILGLPKRTAPSVLKKSKISARSEWSLVCFSLFSAFMVGLYLSKTSVGNPGYFHWLIPGLGFSAAILSLLHPGKRWRTWRAILNIERSWLSREILFFLLFLLTVSMDYFVYDLPHTVGIVNGILLLISIDMLYLPATWKWKFKLHSAQVLLIGISLWLLLAGFEILFILMTLFRSGLYTFRRSQSGHSGKEGIYISLVRIWLPLVAIILLIYYGKVIPVLILTLITDILDRIVFYGDLRVPDLREEFDLSNEETRKMVV
ncbi:MAG: 4Fe-4S binding protein [Bacteroidales bacterium]|nr:4Fe-4S binding protein [Bacteroidales bacterium]